MKLSTIYLASAAVPWVHAIHRPNVDGMKAVWSESFEGKSAKLPNSDEWTVALDIDTNDEAQTYTEETTNVQLSGGDTLQLVPWKNSKGDWTSGRVETKDAWEPKKGKKLRYSAGIRLGDNLQKKGMWPAFWMLGDAVRHGTEWPLCGELDIFEQVNGDPEAYGTVHCEKPEGGVCDEPSGLRTATSLPDNDFHHWSLVIDRTADSWKDETIDWLKDGVSFNKLTGSQIGDEGTWATLAHSPYYIILNVAVGGVWPGSPDKDTDEGYGSMMEVAYVAVYEST